MNRKFVLGFLMILLVLVLGCSVASAVGGNYDGMDWDLTDGVLTLGRAGQTQTLTSRDRRNYQSWPWRDYRNDIVEVICVGSVEMNGPMSGMFYDCQNLTTADLSLLNTTGVTTMGGIYTSDSLFYGCTSLESIDLSSWDVSNVTDLGSLFSQCSSLKSANLSGWNAANATEMDRVFWSCSSLESVDMSDMNVSNITKFDLLFCECENLQFVDLSNWEILSPATMIEMFHDCKSLTSLDLSSWDTSGVTSMHWMFINCSSLTDLNISGWDTQNVTDMGYMFGGCSELTSIDVGGFKTQNVTSMYSMFFKCSKLTSVDVSHFDTRNVVYMQNMFYECSELTSIDVSGWDTGNVINMSEMFYNCNKVTSLDVSGWNTINVNTLRYTFHKCVSLTGLDVSGWKTDNVTDMRQTFSYCSLLTALDVSDWNTSNVTDMCGTFAYCPLITTLDVADWDVSSVCWTGGMFAGCSGLTTLDLSKWSTDSLHTMYQSVSVTTSMRSDVGMFQNCTNLQSLDLSSFDTSKVIRMTNLFYGCNSLVTLNISGWDTSSAKYMNNMFRYCNKVTALDVSSFDTSNVVNTRDMFCGCHALEFLDLSSFDVSNVTEIYEMYVDLPALKEVVLGENNPFVGNGVTTQLPTPPYVDNGIQYTRKWVRADGTFGPYASYELSDNYESNMAGTWVWERVPTEYSITFVCTEDGYVGSMPSVTVLSAEDYELPGNAFFVFGKDFDHWTDGTRRIYADREVIPANTYAVNAEVTLTAVFEPRDCSIDMQDGAFDFTLKADEKALFIPVPASTSYQVYEQTPFGWNLIKQVGNAGTIMPDEESEALFLNKYDPLKATVRFVGTKLMDESVADPDSYNFLLYEDDTLVDIATVGDAGVIEFQPITYEQVGVHNYTIQEAIGNDNSVEYDAHVESIVVTVESDGTGHLSVDIQMDDDEILFENKSKPGLLVLRKAGAGNTDELRVGTFYYDVQFVTQNGQPCELASSEISYEEREGNIEDFPEVQPIEKPKRTLTVKHIARSGSSESVKQTVVEEHCVGDVVTVNAVNIFSPNGDYYYAPCDASENVVRASDGVYKTVMPDRDCEVMLYYRQYRDITMEILWQNVDCTDELDVSAILYADGEQVAVADIVHVGESYVFKKYPAYDVNGRAVNYAVDVPLVDGYAIFKGGQYSFRIAPGFHGQIIWDDFDNAYNTRPGSINVEYEQINPIGLTGAGRGTSGSDDWKYYFILQYPENEYPLYRLYVSSLASWYTMITHNDDPDVGIHDIKLKLTQIQVTGSITWDDNNDSAGVRPELVTINVMRDNTFYQRVDLTSGNDWSFRFWKSLYADDGHVYEYTLQPESVDGYRLDVNGSEITASLLRATISKTLWQSNVNRMGVSSLPLRQVTSFARSYVYESADELPPSAIRIDDGTTSCSIYFWTEDEKAYCWTDADVLAMATDSSGMFNECSRLTSIDLSGFDSSKVTDMTQMFNGCSGLTSLNVSNLDTSSVTSMPSMFYRCSSLTALDVSGFDVSNVTSMSSMFQGCSGLTNLAISDWNTGSLEYMSSMFQGCSALTSLDFSNWNTSKLQGLSRTFWDCYGLTSLDLSMFDTHLVTTMYGMFSNCTNLTTIYVGDQWSLDSVTTTFSMFAGCRSLVGGANTAYSAEHIDGVYARIDNPPDEPGYFIYKASPMDP